MSAVPLKTPYRPLDILNLPDPVDSGLDWGLAAVVQPASFLTMPTVSPMACPITGIDVVLVRGMEDYRFRLYNPTKVFHAACSKPLKPSNHWFDDKAPK